MKAIVLVFLLFITLFGYPAQALAHSVETNYDLSSNSQLKLQVQFSTGEPFQMAPVKVYSPAAPETPWMIGATDDKGEFAFAPDRSLPGNWKVRIGELSHADILTVPVTPEGVEIQHISDATPTHRGQWMVLGFAISGGLGSRLFLRKKRNG